MVARKKDDNLLEDKNESKKIMKELDKFLERKKEELTRDITEKIDEQIEFKVNKRMKEEEKKFVRGKNLKIIGRDIVIVLLLLLVGYFGYCLYKVDYFHIRTKEVVENTPINKEEEVKSKEVKEEIDSSYYIDKYGYLVSRLQINDEDVYSLYLDKITKDDLTNELKLKIAYFNLNSDAKTLNDNMITFEANELVNTAKEIFGDDVLLKDETFTYNKMRFMYFQDNYLGYFEEEEKSSLIYEIDSAKEEDDELIFNVVIAKISDNNELLNNKDKVVLKNYKEESLLDYKDKLSSYEFRFNEKDGTFISIEEVK